MDRRRALSSIAKLVVLIGLAFVYTVLIYRSRTLTGNVRLDGAIGVMLGLFVCSQPAAYIVDLFYRSRSQPVNEPRWIWPVLNLLTFLAGLSLVFIGTLQLARAAPYH